MQNEPIKQSKRIFEKMNELFKDIHQLLTDGSLGYYGDFSFRNNGMPGVSFSFGDHCNQENETISKIMSMYCPPKDHDCELALGIFDVIFQEYKFRAPHFYSIEHENPLTYSLEKSKISKRFFFDVVGDLYKASNSKNNYYLAFCEVFLENKNTFPAQWKRSQKAQAGDWRCSKYFLENKQITMHGFFEKPETLISIMQYKRNPKHMAVFEAELISYVEKQHLQINLSVKPEKTKEKAICL